MGPELSILDIKDWLVEVLPYEVIWIDKEGHIVYANYKFCERLGYKKSEITRLSIYDINTTTTTKSWEKHMGTCKKRKRGIILKLYTKIKAEISMMLRFLHSISQIMESI